MQNNTSVISFHNMMNVTPDQSFSFDPNSARPNKRRTLSQNGRSLMKAWLGSLKGRKPDKDEKASILCQIRANPGDEWFDLNNIYYHLRLHKEKEPKKTQADRSDILAIMFPEISLSARKKYRALVENYPDSFERFIPHVLLGGETVPLEQAKSICNFIRQQLALETSGQVASTSQTQMSPEVSPTFDRAVWPQNPPQRFISQESNAGEQPTHYPTPSSSSSPELASRTLPVRSNMSPTSPASTTFSEGMLGSPNLLTESYSSIGRVAESSVMSPQNLHSPLEIAFMRRVTITASVPDVKRPRSPSLTEESDLKPTKRIAPSRSENDLDGSTANNSPLSPNLGFSPMQFASNNISSVSILKDHDTIMDKVLTVTDISPQSSIADSSSLNRVAATGQKRILDLRLPKPEETPKTIKEFDDWFNKEMSDPRIVRFMQKP